MKVNMSFTEQYPIFRSPYDPIGTAMRRGHLTVKIEILHTRQERRFLASFVDELAGKDIPKPSQPDAYILSNRLISTLSAIGLSLPIPELPLVLGVSEVGKQATTLAECSSSLRPHLVGPLRLGEQQTQHQLLRRKFCTFLTFYGINFGADYDAFSAVWGQNIVS